jgi:hypothetical protein
MFKSYSVADFEVNGLRASLIIDTKMPVESVKCLLNKVMHFCVEKEKEAENEAAQEAKDEKDTKKPELESEGDKPKSEEK